MPPQKPHFMDYRVSSNKFQAALMAPSSDSQLNASTFYYYLGWGEDYLRTETFLMR